ncbi:TRAP transporter small permease [Treponema sp. Marseille-Q4523]|uniref:TRAP transporter small permease n=1 Tax=Treponema sp. Marseille-Q4523 TaxID=2810610 RepID=UPI0019607207|nr:TRAP transporter small permease [Treponema sp. Marseille-Q4523]MBM7022115.1 TRAP transporter small permease [Treponema sp. Marseille-Q4523]
MRKIWAEWDLNIAAIAMVCLVCLTIIGVVFRYILNNPITWLEELQVVLIVWACFLGASAAFRAGKHMCMEFIYEKVSQRFRLILDIFILAVTVFTLALFGYQSIRMILSYTMHNRVSSNLHIPSFANYCIIPICCITMIINDVRSYIEKYSKDRTEFTNKQTMEET